MSLDLKLNENILLEEEAIEEMYFNLVGLSDSDRNIYIKPCWVLNECAYSTVKSCKSCIFNDDNVELTDLVKNNEYTSRKGLEIIQTLCLLG